jgi:hypothetical protein
VRSARALLTQCMQRLVPVRTLGAVALLGCGNASDTVEGGDPLLFVSAPPPLSDGGGSFLDATSSCQPGGASGGHTFTDLYACYFGPSGVVSCESQTTCHGAAGELGVLGSTVGGAGYLCGPTQNDCYQGMLAGQLVIPGSTADPTQSLLYIVLCKYDPATGMSTGLMPQGCPPGSALLPGDLARIAAWIKEGAPNN